MSIQKIHKFNNKIKGEGIKVLNIFNRLINSAKENNGVQGFIKELSENIEKSNTQRTPRKEKSLIQELLEQNKITTSYRDKMHVERSKILYEYAEQTADKGTMYYIYNKDNNEIDTYHLCVCDKENSRKVIEVKTRDLPEGAGVDSVLRIKDGEYVLDHIATNEVYVKMEKMVQQLLEEQIQKMKEHRIENHLYEVVEASSKTVTLIDITIDKNNGECFEKLINSKQSFQNAKEGDIFQYIDGKYIKWNEQ